MYRGRFIIFLMIGMALFFTLPMINIVASLVTGVEREGEEQSDPWRNLWSADFSEGTLSFFMMRCCNKSMQPGRVYIGRGGFLFLGNDFENVMDKTTGRVRPPMEEVDRWTQSVGKIRDIVDAQDGVFAMVIAPNKHSIYSQYLPKGLSAADRNVTDDFIDSARRHELPILDLRLLLRKASEETQVYFNTDTHWNPLGASIAFDQTMEFIEALRGFDMPVLSYGIRPVGRVAGDLANFLKIENILGAKAEQTHIYEIETGPICLSKTDLKLLDFEPCNDFNNRRLSVGGESLGQILMTKAATAPNPQTVLMLCDSFCVAASPLFNANFQTVYRVDWSQMKGELLRSTIERLQPDIVVLHMIERHLWEPDFGLE